MRSGEVRRGGCGVTLVVEASMLTLFRRKTRTLDQPTTDYLLTHYGHLLLHYERSALHAARARASRPQPGSRAERVLEMWMEVASPEAYALTENGLSACERRLAQRLLDEHHREIYFNDCRRCGALGLGPAAPVCACGARLSPR